MLLSARRVGPGGFGYGSDMTEAMLELAERNRAETGLENADFLKGIIEDISLPAESLAENGASASLVALSSEERRGVDGRFVDTFIIFVHGRPRP